jgi:hypothetical protein
LDAICKIYERNKKTENKKRNSTKKIEKEDNSHLGRARDPIQPSKARASRGPLSKPKWYVLFPSLSHAA